jgi:colicin import membrane protein
MSLDMTTEAVASEAGDALPPASEAAVVETPVVETASPAPAEKPKPTMEETIRAAYRNSKRERDETGRFASKNPAPEADAKELADALTTPQEPVEAEAPPPEPKVEPALPPLDPPAHFTAAQKATFANLTREAQEIVLNTEKTREADYTKRAQEHSETRKQFDDYRKAADPFFAALKPFEQYLGQVSQSVGTPVPHMLAGLVRTESQLRTGSPEQKMAALADIATQYGIPLNGVGQENALLGTITQLRQELGQIKGHLSQKQQEDAQRLAAEQRRAELELQTTINEFKKDKPYFEEIRPYAAALLEKGLAPDLQSAYDMAVHANPTVRAQVLADQRKTEEAKRQAEAKAKVEQAKKAAAANVRSGPVANPSRRTMDDTMREAFRRAQSA